MLLNQNIDCRREHNLYKLFKKLPKKIQDDLKKIHPCGNISIDDFELELGDIGQAFVTFRYMYERGNMAYNFQFLIEFLTTLHRLIHSDEREPI